MSITLSHQTQLTQHGLKSAWIFLGLQSYLTLDGPSWRVLTFDDQVIHGRINSLVRLPDGKRLSVQPVIVAGQKLIQLAWGEKTIHYSAFGIDSIYINGEERWRFRSANGLIHAIFDAERPSAPALDVEYDKWGRVARIGGAITLTAEWDEGQRVKSMSLGNGDVYRFQYVDGLIEAVVLNGKLVERFMWHASDDTSGIDIPYLRKSYLLEDSHHRYKFEIRRIGTRVTAVDKATGATTERTWTSP